MGGIECIGGEQKSVGSVEDTDFIGRMAGGVQDLQGAATQIDGITVFDEVTNRKRFNFVLIR